MKSTRFKGPQYVANVTTNSAEFRMSWLVKVNIRNWNGPSCVAFLFRAWAVYILEICFILCAFDEF